MMLFCLADRRMNPRTCFWRKQIQYLPCSGGEWVQTSGAALSLPGRRREWRGGTRQQAAAHRPFQPTPTTRPVLPGTVLVKNHNTPLIDYQGNFSNSEGNFSSEKGTEKLKSENCKIVKSKGNIQTLPTLYSQTKYLICQGNNSLKFHNVQFISEIFV